MRYLLFMGENYYPEGGSGDFVGFYQSVDEAVRTVMPSDKDWAEICDENMEPVAGFYKYGRWPHRKWEARLLHTTR